VTDVPGDVRHLIRYAVNVVASVNPSAWARGSMSMQVDADALRDLADALDIVVPAEVARVRARKEAVRDRS
jgi:hypothetical protein